MWAGGGHFPRGDEDVFGRGEGAVGVDVDVSEGRGVRQGARDGATAEPPAGGVGAGAAHREEGHGHGQDDP